MIKKLLFIFITIFTFSNVNAQEHLVISTTGCTNNPDSIAEFIQVGDINSKNAFQVVQTGEGLSTWATTNFPGVAESPLDFHLEFTTSANRWEVIIRNYPTGTGGTGPFVDIIAFYQDVDISGVLAPSAGWLSNNTACVIATTVTVVPENLGVLDIERNSLDSKISIYPNPSSDFISVSNLNNTARYKITNITGQTVMSNLIDQNNNQIDIQNLSKGFYFVEIEGNKTIKLIKK